METGSLSKILRHNFYDNYNKFIFNPFTDKMHSKKFYQYKTASFMPMIERSIIAHSIQSILLVCSVAFKLIKKLLSLKCALWYSLFVSSEIQTTEHL